MEPSIGRAIGQGFKTANRSWAGMGVMVGCALLIAVVGIGPILLTRPPFDALEEASRPEPALPDFEPTPAVEPTPVVPPAATTNEPAPSVTPTPAPASTTETPAAAPEAKADIFNQLAEPKEAAATPAAVGTQVNEDLAGAENAVARSMKVDSAASREREIDDWFKRAWPILVLSLLIFVLGGVWVNGGQIGYLTQRVNTGSAPVAAFWTAAISAFPRLLLATLLYAVAAIVLVLAAVLLAWVFSLLGALPGWLVGTLAVVVVLAILSGLVWVGVRLAFWFPAIVASRLGPIAGLRDSFQVSQGRWWKTIGLISLMVVIAGAASFIPSYLSDVVGASGSPMAGVLAVILSLLGALMSLYMGFVSTAALLRFYLDAKGSPVTASAGPSTT